jgi:hypothetical protein
MQEVAGHLLRTTNTPWAPWIIVEGTDDRYRSLTVGKTILDSLQKRLADKRDRLLRWLHPSRRGSTVSMC